MEILEAVGVILGTLGGAAIIFWALSSYIGRIWADRYIESVKKEYQKEIESFKKDLELIRESSSRYSSKQFELYTSLYHSLYDLKEKADDLWDSASLNNYKKFSSQLKKTKNDVEKSYLFLEDQHYNKFQEIFIQFSEFEVGKKRLSMMNDEEIKNLPLGELYDLIENNRIRKDEYDILIKEIREDLRQQIRGTN